ncbi:MAG: serine/threonine protein kinase [Planctomycetes bacterium]|nr:serine/threonine protein kinase [Planctomycetota bacterium]
MSRSVQPVQAVAPGTELAGFRVLADLGTGAASRLYLVQDPRTKHVWALKHVVKRTEKDQRFLDQTEIEFNVGSQLKHDNIRTVEKLVKNRKVIRVSEVFLLLEFIDGISLDNHPPETLGSSIAVMTQVAEGLLYMHKLGFVHADMKPNNVIVTDDGLAKIIDLGQSCRNGTVKQRIQGTVDYIAPEQVHRRAITPATDVYNLGATIYWCLTGQNIPTAMSDRTGLGFAKDTSQLELPAAPSEVNPQVPPELSALVLECVRAEPSDRPTMEAIRNRLQIVQVRMENESSGFYPPQQAGVANEENPQTTAD